MEIKFCRRCGAEVTKKEEGRFVCGNNHELFYKTGSVAVGLILVDEDNRILLAVWAINPAKGKMDIPGGFVDFGETLEQAIAREIKEELNLDPNQYSEPQYIIGSTNEYPYHGEVLYPYDMIFWARTNSSITLTPQDDVADVQWVSLVTFNPEEFAFDTSRRAIKLLKQKILS